MLVRPSGSPATVIPDYIPLTGRNPHTGGDDGEFFVSRLFLEDLEQRGPTRKFYDAMLVPETLEEPTAIFEGLNQAGFEDGFCYSRVPTCRWRDDQTRMPLPPLKVFLVYAQPSPMGLVAFDWEWQFVDLNRPGYPKNWRTNYMRQKWPPTN